MESVPNNGLEDWEDLPVSEERKWKDILTGKVLHLQTLLKKAQKDCSSLRQCYQQLREDFLFNLALLDERDRELERYEAMTARALTAKHKSCVSCEIPKQTEEHERMKCNLQFKIRNLERELTLQKQVNLLRKETSAHCQAHLQATDALKASQEFCQLIQTQLQHKQEEIHDLTAIKGSKIKELENELNKLKSEERNYINKYEEVIQVVKDRDAQLKEMEVLAAQIHCMQENQREALQQKDDIIQRLSAEVKTAQTGWDKYMAQVSSEMVAKDTEIITLQKRESKHKTELQRTRDEMEGYKQQLSAALERERLLEQAQVQLELDWQRRCEDMKTEHFFANAQLIQDLTQARDQAKAELKDKERELQDLTVLLHSVDSEGHRAMQGLTIKGDSVASEEIHQLKEQNSILRAVVTHMRKDMEGLSHLLPHPQVQSQAPLPHPSRQPVSLQLAPQPPAQTMGIPSVARPAGQNMCVSVCNALLYCFRITLLYVLCIHSGDPCLQDNSSALHPGVQQGSTVSHVLEQVLKYMMYAAATHVSSAFQSAQLPEENTCLQQQQQQAPGSFFEKMQGRRSSLRLLRTRLKQAVGCIAHLSSEKQQLIEMVNRLRGQITRAGITGSFLERESSMEKQGDQHDRLTTMEQLQYQLTSQELQYMLRQRAFTAQLLSKTAKQNPAAEEVTNIWSQWHQTTNTHEGSQVKSTPRSQLQRSPGAELQPRSGLSRSQLSSEESLPSLNELWDIIDRGLSPSLVSEGDGEVGRREAAESGAAAEMSVRGLSALISSNPPTVQRKKPSTALPHTMKTSRPGASGRIVKIRNYNVKD
ncbi:uncharacterized protein V6R79_014122 [Siganus canaliculatus]